MEGGMRKAQIRSRNDDHERMVKNKILKQEDRK
jgi:hypothetical protein